MADKRNNSSRDIISGLPCELLSYIFGFLPLKEATRTSVLSTKFRHIWRGIDSIDLQDISIGEEPLGLLKTLNVRHLILKNCSHLFEFDGIRFMLKSCPLLETLTFNNLGPARIFLDFVPPFELKPEEFWTKNLIILIISCIETSLKVVEVFGFQGTGNEVLMLQYLILFGSVLEEVNLYLSNEDDGYGSNRENYRKIAEWMQRDIERASYKLRISIY